MENCFKRLTNQRKLILDYLKSVKTHPDAQDVFLKVRKKLPQISFATVYRNLKFLAKNGVIRELRCQCGLTNFDGDMKNHHHFICQQCKKIFDISTLNSINLNKIKKLSIGKVNDFHLYFYGFCKKCDSPFLKK